MFKHYCTSSILFRTVFGSVLGSRTQALSHTLSQRCIPKKWAGAFFHNEGPKSTKSKSKGGWAGQTLHFSAVVRNCGLGIWKHTGKVAPSRFAGDWAGLIPALQTSLSLAQEAQGQCGSWVIWVTPKCSGWRLSISHTLSYQDLLKSHLSRSPSMSVTDSCLLNLASFYVKTIL